MRNVGEEGSDLPLRIIGRADGAKAWLRCWQIGSACRNLFRGSCVGPDWLWSHWRNYQSRYHRIWLRFAPCTVPIGSRRHSSRHQRHSSRICCSTRAACSRSFGRKPIFRRPEEGWREWGDFSFLGVVIRMLYLIMISVYIDLQHFFSYYRILTNHHLFAYNIHGIDLIL